jgi:2,4-dienoyl-CoA reductase-like NADH-dependent reductase (Old Yellow Enzyme family)
MEEKMRLRRLFSSIKIGPVEVRNRIVMLPMGTLLAEADGRPSDALINYYAARAKGGVGLIIGEITIAHRSGKGPHILSLYDDTYIQAWKKLADTVHAHGAKIFPQLAHQGRETTSSNTGTSLLAASPIPCPCMKEMPKELTKEEIEDIAEGFGESARRAKEAGCDGVEVHGAHGYLVCNFLSPWSNKRTDEYGGSLNGRMRFPLEIINKIRAKCGNDFPISFRISSDEMVPGGLVPEETRMIASMLAEAGVNIIDISRANYGSLRWIFPPCGTPIALNANFTGMLKQVLDVPILLGHRISNPLVAEQLLIGEKADLIGMGRALIADPDLPRKAATGRFEDIIPCIACNHGCVGRRRALQVPLSCTLNPTVGREQEMTLVPVGKRKRVLVVGGGLAGMETARVAALRGHDVTLYEKTEKLGGQFNLACVAPMKQEFSQAVCYYATQIKKAGVRVELSKQVTPELIGKMKPDAVVVATGAVPLIPMNLPGVEKPIVTTAHDVLGGKIPLGTKTVIIGGGLVGCEAGEYVAERGVNDISILEMLLEVALDEMFPGNREFLLERLNAFGVKIMTSAKVKKILDDGVVYVRDAGEETIRGVTNVILAMGTQSFDEL